MDLFSRVIGSGKPLIIIHGLFGMSDNWQSLAKQFADFFEVHLIDQRNHGRSFHHKEFNYDCLSKDLFNYIDELDVRQFLLKSLSRNKDKELTFRFNLNSISENIENVGQALEENSIYEGPTLFLQGGNSDYIKSEDEDLIFNHFKQAQIQTIDNAGHWLHAQRPQDFFESVMRFVI